MKQSELPTPIHEMNTLVFWEGYISVSSNTFYRGVAFITARENFPDDYTKYFYTLKWRGETHPRVPERQIRAITFRDFLWYRDPNRKYFKIGRHPAIEILVQVILSIVLIPLTWISGGTDDLPTLLGLSMVTAILVARLITIWIGIRKNFKNINI